jgi:hypothetical protein
MLFLVVGLQQMRSLDPQAHLQVRLDDASAVLLQMIFVQLLCLIVAVEGMRSAARIKIHSAVLSQWDTAQSCAQCGCGVCVCGCTPAAAALFILALKYDACYFG